MERSEIPGLTRHASAAFRLLHAGYLLISRIVLPFLTFAPFSILMEP